MNDLLDELIKFRDHLNAVILAESDVSGFLCRVGRSSKWSALRDSFLEGKGCAACGGTDRLIAHHRVPFHIDPSLELDVENLIPLCESGKYGLNCHLLLGHLGNWRNVNVDVDADVARWSRVFRQEKPTTLEYGKVSACPACDGYGGLAFVGSTGPGIPCGRCNGTGKI